MREGTRAHERKHAQARQGAHAHLTPLAHLLNLPAAPLGSPHTPDHLFRRLTRFLLSKRYGAISRNAVEVPILGSWDVSTVESVGDRGERGRSALLGAGRRRQSLSKVLKVGALPLRSCLLTVNAASAENQTMIAFSRLLILTF